MTGQATGTVKDAAGHPLAGKTVTFKTQSGAIAWRGQTDAQGRYCTAPLDLETYKVNCCGSLYGQCVLDRAVVTYNITCG